MAKQVTKRKRLRKKTPDEAQGMYHKLALDIAHLPASAPT
jgi:hypothetical protein